MGILVLSSAEKLGLPWKSLDVIIVSVFSEMSEMILSILSRRFCFLLVNLGEWRKRWFNLSLSKPQRIKGLNGWVIMINHWRDSHLINCFQYSAAFAVEELSALELPSSYSEKKCWERGWWHGLNRELKIILGNMYYWTKKKRKQEQFVNVLLLWLL